MKFFTIIKEHSQRLPGKNFLPLQGTPLWAYTINGLGVDEVHINTDVPLKLRSYSDVCRAHLNVIPRRSEHVEWEADAQHRGSPVNSMLGDFLDEFVSDDLEPVVLFHVTSPFIRMDTILDASLELSTFASISSVQSIQDFAWITQDEGYEALNFDSSLVARTQDLPEILLSRGAFFILTKESFMRSKTRNPDPHYFYRLDPIESVEIDTRGEFELAQLVAKGLAQ